MELIFKAIHTNDYNLLYTLWKKAFGAVVTFIITLVIAYKRIELIADILHKEVAIKTFSGG